MENTNTTAAKKITKATFKSFIRKNREALLVNVRTRFDGQTDGCESTGSTGFTPALPTASHLEHTLGVAGLWLVLGGGDRFYPYEKDGIRGIEYYNCCGHGFIGIRA